MHVTNALVTVTHARFSGLPGPPLSFNSGVPSRYWAGVPKALKVCHF